MKRDPFWESDVCNGNHDGQMELLWTTGQPRSKMDLDRLIGIMSCKWSGWNRARYITIVF